MKFLEELSARRRFGMKPGLETMRAVCAALGNPERRLKNVLHVAGTNGKGAVCAILDAALGTDRLTHVARYTSPHLVRINERFFLDGAPVSDETLERASNRVASAIRRLDESKIPPVTFFEALTAVAFVVYAGAEPDYTILETGLGGRLDATNVCEPSLCLITKIGLDHCDWLGDTLEKIAAEKAGIIQPGVPVILGRNESSVIEVVRRAAAEKRAPFFYAPDLASDADIPADFPLAGSFNRENALTALAALKVLQPSVSRVSFSRVVWPGRFQRVRNFLVDGAHNPPAAAALAAALTQAGYPPGELVAGFCGDKDVDAVLATLAPHVTRAWAVRTNNPRSLPAEETARRMRAAGISAEPCASLAEALTRCGDRPTLVCGSLFLAGEALVALGAYPDAVRFDPAELLVTH